jgi:hypothetical protein
VKDEDAAACRLRRNVTLFAVERHGLEGAALVIDDDLL